MSTANRAKDNFFFLYYPFLLTYYVVAHFHYVLSMGAVFAMFCAFYFWIAKISGCQYPEWHGQAHFWTFFLGVNLTFFPMHWLGLAGMRRRIYDFPESFAPWNALASFGSYRSARSALYFFYVLYRTLGSSSTVGNNPWEYEGGSQPIYTLEWLRPSPPTFHTFAQPPVIRATPLEL